MNKLKKTVWNAQKSVGEREALTIFDTLHIHEDLTRRRQWHDLALFTTAIDTMLRSGDLRYLRVCDVTDENGRVLSSIPWRQEKTKRNVSLVLSELTKKALQDWIDRSGKEPHDYLFTGSKKPNAKPISRQVYADRIKSWVRQIGLSPAQYSTHSLRRTKPTFMYEYGYSKIEYISKLLGHADITSTLRYLSITRKEAERHARSADMFTVDVTKLVQLSPLCRELLNPEFMDRFVDAIWERAAPKISALIDERLKAALS